MESTWNFSPINERATNITSSGSNACTLGNTVETIRQQMEFLETLKNYVKPGCISRSLSQEECGGKGQLHFKRVTKSDISQLSHFFERFPSRSCDYSIGGILMWTDYFDYEMAISDSSLFIKGYDKESDILLYYAPLGLINKEDAMVLIKNDALNHNCDAILISDVETVPEATIRDAEEPLDFCAKWMEYLYDIDRFLHFSGKKMEKKRNHLNYFTKHYPDHTVEEISEMNIQDIIAFTKRFEKTHIDSALFNYESSQTFNVLYDYRNFPFEGLLIRLGSNVIGYTFGEKIGDTFFVHVEKADIEFQGAYQALASKLAQYVNEKYPDVKYLNREEDMGNEALRKSKESYHPSLLINKRITRIK